MDGFGARFSSEPDRGDSTGNEQSSYKQRFLSFTIRQYVR
jgi:hypothetical protein